MLMIFFICTLMATQSNTCSDCPIALSSVQKNPANVTLRFIVAPEVINPTIQLGKPLHHKTDDGRKLSTHAVLPIIMNGYEYFTYANDPRFNGNTHETQLRYDPKSRVLLAIIPRKQH